MGLGTEIALIKALGGALPPITAADAGKVLTANDSGVWGASNNTVTISLNVTDGIITLDESEPHPATLDELYSLSSNGSRIALRLYDTVEGVVYSFFANAVYTEDYIEFSAEITKANGADLDHYHVAVAFANEDNSLAAVGTMTQTDRFIVTLTPTAADYSGTMDKTVAEIDAAYKAGRKIVFRVLTGQDAYMEADVTFVTVYGGTIYPMFEAFVTMTEKFIGIFNEVTQDGTSTAYTTEIYTLTPAT